MPGGMGEFEVLPSRTTLGQCSCEVGCRDVKAPLTAGESRRRGSWECGPAPVSMRLRRPVVQACACHFSTPHACVHMFLCIVLNALLPPAISRGTGASPQTGAGARKHTSACAWHTRTRMTPARGADARQQRWNRKSVSHTTRAECRAGGDVRRPMSPVLAGTSFKVRCIVGHPSVHWRARGTERLATEDRPHSVRPRPALELRSGTIGPPPPTQFHVVVNWSIPWPMVFPQSAAVPLLPSSACCSPRKKACGGAVEKRVASPAR